MGKQYKTGHFNKIYINISQNLEVVWLDDEIFDIGILYIAYLILLAINNLFE